MKEPTGKRTTFASSKIELGREHANPIIGWK
jgi:hypothetical protein